jgi:hypothetical protein
MFFEARFVASLRIADHSGLNGDKPDSGDVFAIYQWQQLRVTFSVASDPAGTPNLGVTQ